MRVFLDTKSDQLRVELAQGVVAATYAGGGKKEGQPKIEVDVAKGGEVIAVRIDQLGELMDELELKRVVQG